jgi:hypothetical protein
MAVAPLGRHVPRFGLHIGIPTDLLTLAADGINGPTFAQIGEAGAEAVIPLTRPARALQLMDGSRLTDMVRRQHSKVPVAEEFVMRKVMGDMNVNEPVVVDVMAPTLMLKYRAVVPL